MSDINAMSIKNSKSYVIIAFIYAILCALSVLVNIILTAILVVSPILVGGFLYIIKNPKWVVLAVFGSLYVGNLFYIVPSESFPITLFKVVLIGVILLFIFTLMNTKKLHIDLIGLEIEILLLAAFIAISLVWSPVPMEGAFYAIRFAVSLTMCYSVFNLIQDRKTVQQLFLLISVASICVAILSVRDLLSNPYAAVQAYLSGGTKIGDRATVVDIDPNIVSTLFFLPAFYGASLYSNLKAEKKMQIFGGIIVAACLAGSLATLSRSGLLSLGVGLAIISFKMRSQRLIITAIIGALIILVIKPDLVFTLTSLVRRFTGLFTGEVDNSASIRINLMVASWDMFVNSNFIGIGFRGFGTTYLATHYVSSAAQVYEPHNMTYTIYTELGLHGFLLVSWIVIYTFRTALENLNTCLTYQKNASMLAINQAVFTSLVAYMIFFQFLSGAYNNNLFLLCCTLTFILRKVMHNDIHG